MKSLFERENLKRGDKILAADLNERIFLAYIEGAKKPYVCVSDYCNTSFLMGEYFSYTPWGENEVSAVEKPWYENIPESGVVCWVWDGEPTRKIADVIVRYDKSTGAEFQSNNGLFWKNAKPIKPEELYQGEVK